MNKSEAYIREHFSILMDALCDFKASGIGTWSQPAMRNASKALDDLNKLVTQIKEEDRNE